MHLVELEVEHWRGLSGKLGPFSPTLNLICGPNESGKSRFFQALRFALFESHKGTAQHKKDLQSWTSPESPVVRLGFEVDGTRYTLAKRYLKGAYAELSGGGKTLQGAAAEQRLLQLTGGREGSGRGEAAEDAMGIWPLLMVAQGDSRRPVSAALNGDSQARLQDLLADEIGTAAISATGKKLLELARLERDRYFTPTGQEKPVLRQARARYEQARDDLRQAQEHYAKQASTAVELAELRRQLTDLAVRLDQARKEAMAAAQKADAAREARSERDGRRSDRDLAASRKDNADTLLANRKVLEAELAQMDAGLQSRRASLRELAAHERELEVELEQQDLAAQQALDTRDSAGAHFKLAQKSAQLGQINAQILALGASIQSLQANESCITERRARRARSVEVSANKLACLRELEQACKVSKAQLDGAAMRIAITAQQALNIDGQALDAGREREILVTGREQITLDGIATIDIRPQQGSFDELRARLDAAQQRLKDELDQLGLESVAAAAQAENIWSQLSRDIGNLEREAKLLSPRPLSELKEELARYQAQQAGLSGIESDMDLPAAQDALEAAQQAFESVQSQRSAVDKLLQEQRGLLAVEAAKVEQLAEQQADGRRKLEAMPALDALEGSLSGARQALGEAQLSLDAAIRRFEALGGEQVTDDAQRLERAAAKLKQRQSETKSRLDELQGSLRMLVQSGSYEQVQDCEAELERASAELQRLERDAAAARRLHAVLASRQQELVDRLTAPVIQRIQPYLADIFPGSSLHHGESLDFTGLQSRNLKEEFSALSGGAQEQFALMARIGLAELFAGHDRLPLVLDDGLINSDADRIRRVHRVLDRASQRLQIIILTCHEPLFDALGADFHQRLSATRSGA